MVNPRINELTTEISEYKQIIMKYEKELSEAIREGDKYAINVRLSIMKRDLGNLENELKKIKSRWFGGKRKSIRKSRRKTKRN
jgi:hypothetical protein